MKYGILFDLDGTLLDSLADLTGSVNYALVRYGLPARTAREIRSFLGNGARQLVALAMPGLPTDPPVDQVLTTYRDYYKDHSRDHTKPYEGIQEALEVLKDIPLAVVSNKPDRDTVKLCADFFPGVLARGEKPGCPRKPAPDMLYAVMQELDVDTCIYVGDSDVDVKTAHNAGVKCLSVLWGYRDEEDIREAGQTNFCADPKDLPFILREMME